jgi:hypothetical protein
LARAIYFLVLNSFGFENLKQTEILFTSEKAHSGQTASGEICAVGKVRKL